MSIQHKLAVTASVLALAVPAIAHAQTSAAAYTSATRYDGANRVVGTIAPDPDGSGALKYAATRTTYDDAGRPTKVETGELSTWKSEAVAPSAWGTDFTVLSSAETTYEVMGRKTREVVKGSNSAIVSATEYSYDNLGRLECTKQRMNPSNLSVTQTNACIPGAQGTGANDHGPDRVTKSVYDDAGQVLQIRKAVGTALEYADVTASYSDNGLRTLVIDANGNKAELQYDGHDRLEKWVFPSKTGPGAFNDATVATALSTAGTVDTTDYELYGYDANGNRTSLRKRDASVITYTYDDLNRMTVKTIPNRAGLDAIHERNVHYTYDSRGLQTGATFDSISGVGATNSYNGFGEVLTASANTDGVTRQLTYQYDPNGNRNAFWYPDNQKLTYGHDGLNRLTAVAHSGTTLISSFYNNRGSLSYYERAPGGSPGNSGYYRDTAGRLSTLLIDGVLDTSHDVSWNFTRNPASQIATETRNNDSYAWTGHANVDRDYTTNGLNQYDAAGGASFTHDANGNLTSETTPAGTTTFLYDIENRLVRVVSPSATTNLYYDPLGRLYRTSSSASGQINYVYDGDALVAEYLSNGAMSARYVHGADAGADDPLLSYAGTSMSVSNVRFLFADPRGSIVLSNDTTGNAAVINTYDEYGIPGAANQGRFQYTGQAWLDEIGMYYYKARIYSPTLGRFLQTDPIGYEDQYNLYAYVGNDPINGVDPTGLFGCTEGDAGCSVRYQENGDGSVTVTRTETTVVQLQGNGDGGTRLRFDTEEQGSVKLLPQATAGGKPAPLKGDMQHSLLNLSESIDNRTVEVTSGFRTQEAQDEIRRGGNPRAARRSPHTYNEAADIKVQGMSPSDLADAADASGEFARSNEYPSGGNVHVDQNTNANNQGRLCNYRPC